MNAPANPPGDGQLYDPFSPALAVDPYPIYETLRDEHPLYENTERGFFVLSRFADILRALRDWKSFSSAQGLTFVEDEMKILGLAPTFIMMDPPKHTLLRKLISKGFTHDRVAQREQMIRDWTRTRVAKMAERLRDGETLNLVEELASPLPTMVLADLLGVPEEDRPQFDPWSAAITQAAEDGPKRDQAVVAVAQLFQYFIKLIERRKRDPGDDMLSALLAADVDGDQLSGWDILGFCFVFIAGGNDTTTHMVGTGAVELFRNPEERELLLADPARIPGAVEEMLRYEAPVQGLSRTLTEAVELHGRRVPAGKKVHMLFASGNRDPRQFGDDAHLFRVTRDVPRHLSFSQGPHFCIGAHLARLMGRIAFEELLAALPGYVVDIDLCERVQSAFVRGYDHVPIHL